MLGRVHAEHGQEHAECVCVCAYVFVCVGEWVGGWTEASDC